MSQRAEYVQPINPTDEERHEMLKIALEKAKLSENYNDILASLSPPKDITRVASFNQCKGLKVGIIGGGLAGLAAAFELRKLGFNITIFEAQESRIGGRVYTYYFDKDKKFYGELGAMRVAISHETTWHYINLFNLKTRPFVQTSKNSIIYVRNKRAQNDSYGKSVMEKIYPEFDLTSWEKNTSWQNLIDHGLATKLLNMDPSVRKEILQIKNKYPKEIEELDSLSIRKVMEEMKLSRGAIELISSVAPLLGAFYNMSYLENMIEQYTVDSSYRYEIVGGTVNLPLAFYNSLMCEKPKEYFNIEEKNLGKVVWKNGKTVTGIYKEDKGNVTLGYKSEKSLEKFYETFDFVICTIPFSSLRNVEVYPMFSTGKMQAIKEVNYASAQKTIFMCKERFWESGGGGSLTDLPIQTIWYSQHDDILNGEGYKKYHKKHKKVDENKKPGVLLASYNLGQDAIRLGNLDDKMRIESIKRQVELVHGLQRGYLDSVVEDFKTIKWNDEKGIYGGFCYFMPEQQSNFLYDMVKPEYNNKVYFAGEHTSTAHGWIQGAVHSAMKAANAIAEYCS